MNDIYPRSVGVIQALTCLVILTIFCHYEVFSLMEIVPLTALSKICLQLWLLKLRTICFNLFERPPAVSLGQSEPWSWPEPASQLTTLSVSLFLSHSWPEPRVVEEQVLREGSQEGAEQESDFSGEEREKCLHYISKGAAWCYREFVSISRPVFTLPPGNLIFSQRLRLWVCYSEPKWHIDINRTFCSIETNHQQW